MKLKLNKPVIRTLGLLLIVFTASSYSMMSLNTILGFKTNPSTQKKMDMIGKHVDTTYGPEKVHVHTKMTNSQFKAYVAKKTQKQIDKLSHKYKH